MPDHFLRFSFVFINKSVSNFTRLFVLTCTNVTRLGIAFVVASMIVCVETFYVFTFCILIVVCSIKNIAMVMYSWFYKYNNSLGAKSLSRSRVQYCPIQSQSP